MSWYILCTVGCVLGAAMLKVITQTVDSSVVAPHEKKVVCTVADRLSLVLFGCWLLISSVSME